jgi:hypothetical protein
MPKAEKKSEKTSGAGVHTKQQLEVPASMAEQLDPPLEDHARSFGGVVADPETRGVTKGDDLKAKLEKADEADKKAGEQSIKHMEKVIAGDDETVASTGEPIPSEVTKKAEEDEKLRDEAAKNMAKQTEEAAKAARDRR